MSATSANRREERHTTVASLNPNIVDCSEDRRFSGLKMFGVVKAQRSKYRISIGESRPENGAKSTHSVQDTSPAQTQRSPCSSCRSESGLISINLSCGHPGIKSHQGKCVPTVLGWRAIEHPRVVSTGFGDDEAWLEPPGDLSAENDGFGQSVSLRGFAFCDRLTQRVRMVTH